MTDEVELGTILFTMVEPHRGHEVAYNRWYERDHFYAGCLVGPYCFSGSRWVCPRRHKDLREPPGPSPITPDPTVGSYLALYWILAGHHDDWNRWAVDQVNMLHREGRMFAERDHVHTLLYRYDWRASRDGHDGGVPAELALDHRYGGLAVVVGELAEGVERGALDAWYRDEHLPRLFASGAVDQCLAFSPLPLLDDAPGDVPRTVGAERRFLHLHFLEADPAGSWADAFASHGAELAETGLGTVLWASPFVPTVPGTDSHTDRLW